MPLLRCTCLVCRRPGPALCDTCSGRLVPPPSGRIRGVGRVPAAFAYEGTGARVVQALKYRDGRRLVGPLADLMSPLVADEADRRGAGAITWLPTTAAHRRDRGFDQAELLARSIGRRLGLPVLPALRRRPGDAQTGRSRDAREHNATFVARRGLRADAVVAIDDVCTTGATARAAVAEFARSGTVAGVVVAARTP